MARTFSFTLWHWACETSHLTFAPLSNITPKDASCHQLSRCDTANQPRQSVVDCIPQAHNSSAPTITGRFFFSKFGGGKSRTKPLIALWMYNKSANCLNMQQVEADVNAYLNQLHPTDRHYCLKITNKQQCMCGKSASLGVNEWRKQTCPSEDSSEYS